MIKFNEILKHLGIWKFWKEFMIMTVGMFIAAAAVYFFLVPSKLIIGSISGLSIVLTNILNAAGINIRLSVVIFVINAILLVLAYFLIDREFGVKTVYTALILGPFTDLWAAIVPAESLFVEGTTSVMGDPWLDLVCFVLVLSISQSILFNINASTGGLDILAKIINKYLHIDLGTSITCAGAAICCTAFFINPFSLVVLGLIGTWINGLVVDYFSASINRRKRVCIICEEPERIRRFIIDDLSRGCTLYDAKGGHHGNPKIEIQTIITKDEFAQLMDFVKKSGVNAFITAGNVSEIYGMWASKETQHKNREEEKTPEMMLKVISEE